jgi:hypothetical protein
MTADPQHVVLTETALVAIMESDDKILQTWREIARHFGHDSIEAWAETLDDGRLRPGGVAIPREQTERICAWLLDDERNPALERVNTMLDWLNVGPSTFEAVTS